MNPPPTHLLVSPDALATAPGWFPGYFAGPASIALRASRDGLTVIELGGSVLEGWRVSETPHAQTYDSSAAKTPIYRQSNVGRLRLVLSEAHWTPPQGNGRWYVRPGDVVVNKLTPVRAALVPPAARRHPVDGNSLIVRGLPLPAATWLALCLNQPEYQQLLLIESGVLRRVNLRALENLRLPPVPELVRSLSVQLRDLLDEFVLVGESMQRLKNEAAAIARGIPNEPNLRPGIFVHSPSMSSDSWLPTTAALRARQIELAERFSWSALRSIATTDRRVRLLSTPENFRVLRLRDVGDDLFATASDAPTGAHDFLKGRTLSQPLVEGDVLLSTVGTSFRALYVDEGVLPNTFLSDGLVRLRFHETPAAWALLISTPQVRWQTIRLAIGSFQQFVPPESLLSIYIPLPERKTRDLWQRAIERHHAQRRLLEARRNSLEMALTRVFEATHGLPPAYFGPDEEPLQ